MQALLTSCSEQGIDLQTTLGGGIGKYLKNARNTRISVLGGLALQRTDYRQSSVPQTRRNVASGFVSADLRFFKFSATNLSVNATVFPAFADILLRTYLQGCVLQSRPIVHAGVHNANLVASRIGQSWLFYMKGLRARFCLRFVAGGVWYCWT
jgi:hypothetical protein